ncbi:NifU family protein [Streptomyces sp. NPDC006743]|uniref:NifU family protein n=1 Tax=Streptomyces sp. NPDC006743 TaxID=3154480 RepID=UPI0034548D27
MAEAAEQSPAARLTDAGAEARLARIDGLLAELESAPGPTAGRALEAVRLLSEVYGEALARLLEHAGGEPDGRAAVTEDELVGHLLVLHGIHPEPAERRAARAVERLRPAVRERGGDVEWVGLEGRVARVRVSEGGGGCGAGCGAAASGLVEAVREAVLAAAPELAGVERLPEPSGRRAAPAFVPLDALARPASRR